MRSRDDHEVRETSGMTDRCRGDCCRKFYLPVTTADALRGGFYAEGDTIADMIVKLPPQETNAAGDPIPEGDPKRDHFWTCRNLLPSGDCGIYETRPGMCSGFPYGKPCEYKNCQSACAREGVVKKA